MDQYRNSKPKSGAKPTGTATSVDKYVRSLDPSSSMSNKEKKEGLAAAIEADDNSKEDDSKENTERVSETSKRSGGISRVRKQDTHRKGKRSKVEKVEDKKVEEDRYGVSHIRITNTITEDMKSLAKKLGKAWGYRSKPDGEHDKYELTTHDSENQPWGRILQYFTDPVFRNMQQIGESGSIPMSYDTTDFIDKQDSEISGLVTFWGEEPIFKMRELIQRFMNEKDNRSDLEKMREYLHRFDHIQMMFIGESIEKLIYFADGDELYEGSKIL